MISVPTARQAVYVVSLSSQKSDGLLSGAKI